MPHTRPSQRTLSDMTQTFLDIVDTCDLALNHPGEARSTLDAAPGSATPTGLPLATHTCSCHPRRQLYDPVWEQVVKDCPWRQWPHNPAGSVDPSPSMPSSGTLVQRLSQPTTNQAPRPATSPPLSSPYKCTHPTLFHAHARYLYPTPKVGAQYSSLEVYTSY